MNLVNRLEVEQRTSPTGQTVWIAWVCVVGHQFRSSRTWPKGREAATNRQIDPRRLICKA